MVCCYNASFLQEFCNVISMGMDSGSAYALAKLQALLCSYGVSAVSSCAESRPRVCCVEFGKPAEGVKACETSPPRQTCIFEPGNEESRGALGALQSLCVLVGASGASFI